ARQERLPPGAAESPEVPAPPARSACAPGGARSVSFCCLPRLPGRHDLRLAVEGELADLAEFGQRSDAREQRIVVHGRDGEEVPFHRASEQPQGPLSLSAVSCFAGLVELGLAVAAGEILGLFVADELRSLRGAAEIAGLDPLQLCGFESLPQVFERLLGLALPQTDVGLRQVGPPGVAVQAGATPSPVPLARAAGRGRA